MGQAVEAELPRGRTKGQAGNEASYDIRKTIPYKVQRRSGV